MEADGIFNQFSKVFCQEKSLLYTAVDASRFLKAVSTRHGGVVPIEKAALILREEAARSEMAVWNPHVEDASPALGAFPQDAADPSRDPEAFVVHSVDAIRIREAVGTFRADAASRKEDGASCRAASRAHRLQALFPRAGRHIPETGLPREAAVCRIRPLPWKEDRSDRQGSWNARRFP